MNYVFIYEVSDTHIYTFIHSAYVCVYGLTIKICVDSFLGVVMQTSKIISICKNVLNSFKI